MQYMGTPKQPNMNPVRNASRFVLLATMVLFGCNLKAISAVFSIPVNVKYKLGYHVNRGMILSVTGAMLPVENELGGEHDWNETHTLQPLSIVKDEGYCTMTRGTNSMSERAGTEREELVRLILGKIRPPMLSLLSVASVAVATSKGGRAGAATGPLREPANEQISYSSVSNIASFDDLPIALPLQSDELTLDITAEPLGLGLAEFTFKNSQRVIVNSVKDFAADATKLAVKSGMIVVSLNGRSVEGLPLEKLYPLLKEALALLNPNPSSSPPSQSSSPSKHGQSTVRLTFRDPTAFFELLKGRIDRGDDDQDNNNQPREQGGRGVQIFTTTLLPPLLASSSATPLHGLIGPQVLIVKCEEVSRGKGEDNISTRPQLSQAQVGDTLEILYRARTTPNLHRAASVLRSGGSSSRSSSNDDVTGLPFQQVAGVSDPTLLDSNSYQETYLYSVFFVLGGGGGEGGRNRDAAATSSLSLTSTSATITSPSAQSDSAIGSRLRRSQSNNNRFTFFGDGKNISNRGHIQDMGEFLSLLPGNWDLFLSGMQVHEKRTLTLPPCYYYNAALAIRAAATNGVTIGQHHHQQQQHEELGLTPLVLDVRLLSINGEV